MYIIENLDSIEKIMIKKNQYISIFSDDMKILEEICNSFHIYFSEKRVSSDKKIMILDYSTGEKEQIASKFPIYLSDNSIMEEIEMGSRTILYKRILDFFKERFPIEPAFMTMNVIVDNFFQEEISQILKKELSKYSEYDIDFKFNELTPADLIKKIEFKYFKEGEEERISNISNLEKLKLKLSIYENSELANGKEKIYIFYLPENSLSISDIKKLKEFLLNLSESSVVVVATNSKYILANELDGINIIKDKKLINWLKEEELKKEFVENYPILKEWSGVKDKLLYLIKSHFLENMENLKITNKVNTEVDGVSLSSYEDIFILLFFAKTLNLEAILDLDYEGHCVFSNYIEKKFKN